MIIVAILQRQDPCHRPPRFNHDSEQDYQVDGIILDSPFHSMKYALTSTTLGRALNYVFNLEQFMEDIHLVFDTPKVQQSRSQQSQNVSPQHLASVPEVPVRVFHAVVDQVGRLMENYDDSIFIVGPHAFQLFLMYMIK